MNMLLYYLQQAVARGTVQLAHGGESDVYVDVRRVLCSMPGRTLIGEALWNKVQAYRPVGVGGAGVGGLLVAQAVGYFGGCSTFMVREHVKNHGLQRQIEGVLEEDDEVILCEDVVTTGKSVLAAARAVVAAGASVLAIGTVLDRGGSANIEAAGFPCISVCTLEDVLHARAY